MRSLVASLICVLVLAITGLAEAAPGTPAQRADAAMKDGQSLEKAGKKEEALAKFEEAYAIAPTGTAAYSMARLEAGFAQHGLALHHYREALRDPKLPTEIRRDAEAAVEELRTKIGILILDVPEAATTTVDAKEVDAKQPAEVMPGMHVVKIRLGGETKSADVQATAGSVTQVKLRFGADETTNASGPGPVGQPTGPTSPPAKTESKWPVAKLVTVGVSAVVAAGLVTSSAVVFATADYDKNADSGLCTRSPGAAPCRDLSDKRDAYDGQRTTTTILFYSGLVVGAVAAGAAILWPNQRVALTSGLGSGGMVLRF